MQQHKIVGTRFKSIERWIGLPCLPLPRQLAALLPQLQRCCRFLEEPAVHNVFEASFKGRKRDSNYHHYKSRIAASDHVGDFILQVLTKPGHKCNS